MSPTNRPGRHPWLQRWTLVCCAGLPVIWAVCIQFVGAQATVVNDPQPPPALVFNQYLARPYLPEPQAVVSARFRFINHGQHPVDIQQIDRSCGCLGQQLRDTHLEPGEEGELMLSVQTANEEPGLKEYFAVVRYTDPHPREAKLTLKFEMPDNKVSVEPKALLFYQFGTDPVSKTITIRDHRRDRLRITDIDCNSPFVTLGGIQTSQRRKSTEYLFDVTVAGNVPPGQHRSVVIAYTDDVKFPQIIVPLYVQGPVVDTSSSLQVEPGQIKLMRTAEDGAESWFRITVAPSESEFQVTAVETAPVGINVEIAPAESLSDQLVQVKGRVTLHKDFPPGVTRGLITLHTNDPGRSRVEIPVQISMPAAETGQD